MSRFGRLLAHGTCYTAGVQLSNVAVVLPYICAQQGNLWAAGLLLPAFNIGTVAGNFASPFILNCSRHRRHLVVAGASAAMATLAACNAVAARSGVLLSALLLTTSAAIGAVAGITSVAFSDLLVAKLPEARRGELLLTQGAAGSTLATLLTLLAVPMLAHGDLAAGRVDLLWLGAAGLAGAGVAAVFVGPVDATERRAMRAVLADGLVAAQSQRWFRSYLCTQLFFVPITFGATFYSLRTAQSGGDLHVLVIFSSAGLVLGSALWRAVYRARGVRGMLTGSALLSSAAAITCAVVECHQQWCNGWTRGIVLLLATVAGQAVFAAGISWIGAFACDRDRAVLISFASLTVAVLSSGAGAVLGRIASNHSTTWPVVIVLLLSLAAASAGFRAGPGHAGGRNSGMRHPPEVARHDMTS